MTATQPVPRPSAQYPVAASLHRDFPVDFQWVATDEPHATRRKQIMAKYPHITKLYGPDPNEAYKIIAFVLIQFIMAFIVRDWPIVPLLLAMYIVSGTLNQGLFLGGHELSHNLVFETPLYNQILGYITNLPAGVASFITFKRYHLEHHMYQGVDGIDVDLPSDFELKYIKGVLPKFVFVVVQILFYAIRPMLVRPKKVLLSEIIGWTCQLSFDAIVVYFLGWKSMFYFAGGSVIGGGFHPMAGHFIAEHYVTADGYETYSYYGKFWNFFAFNVGMHNEHHDFPRIPGSRLPLVRQIAPEFYRMPACDSWFGVIVKYIFDPTMGPHSRVKRLPREMRAKFAEANPSTDVDVDQVDSVASTTSASSDDDSGTGTKKAN